jgi:uncharacterized protein YigA (DUF484 family)
MADEVRERLSAAEVATYLRRHPRFLEQYPDIGLTLVVPRDNGASASLASYQLEVLRDKNRELTRRLHELFGNAQDNERLAVRTHQLTLALMRTRNAADTLRALVAVLGEDFHGDLVRLVLFRPVAGLEGAEWLQVLPASDPRFASFDDVLKHGEPVCGRLQPEKLQLLFGERHGEAASVALLPVAGVGLVAVGSFDGNRFFPGMGTLFLRLMAESIGTALARFAEG